MNNIEKKIDVGIITMLVFFTLLIFFTITGIACSKNTSQQHTNQIPADNSGINTRDNTLVQNNPKIITPENQQENEVDLGLTQKIRKEIVDDNSLSINAKNIKIITANGFVTLRGPVNTLEEKNNIINKVTRLAGAEKINNQLEILFQ